MEHKLILGGEQYLPFARSRIKALRAGGMKFASQQFVMPDAEVRVRVVGNQDYIRLTGAGYEILSGVTYPGDIISGDPDTLRSFKPTTETLKIILGDTPANAAFHDEKRLAVSAHADLGVGGSQYKNICPSMYSGTMTKLVQSILGLGKNKKNPDGVQLRYDYRWVKCHGVLTDAEQNKWIVQISADGVFAMRVPVYSGSAGAVTSKLKAVREAAKLFGGVPSGEPFPTGAALTAAIAAGTVKQLAAAGDMTPAYSKSSYSTAMGWSFNEAGTEAHNTCYSEAAGVYTSYHYKLDIGLSGATLSLVTSGVVKGGGRFKFWQPGTSNYLRIPNNTWSSGGAELTKVPVFVCHINGVLEVVSHCMRHTAGGATDEYGPGTKFMSDYRSGTGYAVNPYNATWRVETGAYAYSTYAESTSIPGVGSAGIATTTWSGLSTYGTFMFSGNQYDCPAYTRVRVQVNNAESVGCTLDGTRDGFCLRSVSKTLETAVTNEIHESDAGVAVGVWQGYVSGSVVGPPVNDYLYGATSQTPTPGTPPYTALVASSVTAAKTDTVSSLSDGRGRIDTPEVFASAGDQTTTDNVWKSTSGSFNLRASKFGTEREIIFSTKHTAGNAVNSDGVLLNYSSYADPYISFVGYI
jgi:hypothetical protein